ncbi:general secretion pathway protein GspB [Caballeronia zhejiangensis]|uniref:Type II secretion system protein GspB C-terminal domain-containing protein n=1 Tax=Caballeronia zhejiangensis TaxID=871203 RepID=A0A656QBX3_9BURK|nr:general secretion pathway protein GspB [Caballeronia zhejiangensis]KAK42482.1 hypothetical protein BG58_41600 [Caballeronia jiangsuensis]KDR24700.1 hypothetical protein BG60_35705 [Caballeronia zhejiangensis]BBQ03169.1 hypothetical protein BSFA1_82970 [Burkholderia sp. SFA1]
MSYILDALKRAESDRGRGSVPGLHTQQVMPGSDVAGTERPVWLWPVVTAGVAVAGLVVLYLVNPVTVRIHAGSPVAASLPPPTVSPPPAAALPVPQITAVTAVESTPDASAPEGGARSRRRAAATDALTANEPRVYAVADLPPDVRNALPKVAVGGSSYSTNPALRMLMVNGQMYQERDPLGPELTLEQIRQGSAVLRFRGYRYRISF